MKLEEDHVYETPDGRRYLAGIPARSMKPPGMSWALRPYPTVAADIRPPGDYAARVRAAFALVALILWVEEDTGALHRLSFDHLGPDAYGPVDKAIAATWRRAPTEAEHHWEETGWTVADLIHHGPRPG